MGPHLGLKKLAVFFRSNAEAAPQGCPGQPKMCPREAHDSPRQAKASPRQPLNSSRWLRAASLRSPRQPKTCPDSSRQPDTGSRQLSSFISNSSICGSVPTDGLNHCSGLTRAKNCALFRILAPPGSSCVLLAPPGSSWLFLAPPGSPWLLLAPPGSCWLLLAPPSSSLELPGTPPCS